MTKISLSYILTTYNKYDFIKITLPYLLAACKPDEEIVVVDGGSTDGTSEYLKELFDSKKIHYFISEKDSGEAHGTNKAMLAARGELIKIITDDDVFDFEAIQKCKTFMFENPAVHILGFDGLSCKLAENLQLNRSNFIVGYKEWQKTATPFLFCGLSFMLRRSALSYLGLFDVNYKIIDMEYAIRVSSLKTNIAFYSGLGFVNIVNPSSNSVNFYEAIRIEQKKLAKIHPSIKINFKLNNTRLVLKEKISQMLRRNKNVKVIPKGKQVATYTKAVLKCLEALEQEKKGSDHQILFK